MSQQHLDKNYDSRAVEARWGKFWIEEKLFHVEAEGPGSSYTIVIPPPNVTGSLHIGHALTYTLQDILIRWRRMQGYNTLWLPGTDHAGIATQNVVEKKLLAEGKTRQEVGREQFIKLVWEWKEQSGNTIIHQLKQLGASCDWDRLRFTMDEGLSQAVREVFIRLYEDGLIYRGERLINWCPRCRTALSDIEVEHEEIKGKLYHIRYFLRNDPDKFLVVATTRPETMFGDTAVAIHPADPRYKHLNKDQLVHIPLTTKTIPIKHDEILVDQEFGSGVVKITPGHDFNDFEAGERHNLPIISIFTEKAHLDGVALLNKSGVERPILEKIADKAVMEARPIIVDELETRGHIEKIEEHKMALGRCYRCKTVVEPYLSPQWFVKIKPLAEPAIQAVESGRIRIIPEGWANNYFGWMRNIKDWCISRQIWWGHRIPAWFCRDCYKEGTLKGLIADENWTIPADAKPIVSRTSPKHCPNCGKPGLIQDPDVLDTWFSSALWPFSTLGWPKQTHELRAFYPTSTLVTGLDILFFWVSRMIMMGLKFTGDVPFRDVYIHALVRDAEGQKMSKSKGNVIDPLTKMQEYGTDALRFTLASMASPGRDIKLAEERIEGYRNFVTKIWNAARFILLHTEGQSEILPVQERSFADRWIFARLNQVIVDSINALEAYRFDRAASILYQFLWHEYCDWYIELVKPVLQRTDNAEARSTRHTLLESFEVTQRLLHPLMPFITEEIWQALPHKGKTIVLGPYPQPNKDWEAPDIEVAFTKLEQFVNLTRTSRALLNCGPTQSLFFLGTSKNAKELDTLKQVHHHLQHLSRGTVQLSVESDWPTTKILKLVVGSIMVGTKIEGDIDLQNALKRIKKQTQEKQKEVTRLEKRLASPDFVAKAEPEVVQDSTERLNVLKEEMALLLSSETQLQTMLGH